MGMRILGESGNWQRLYTGILVGKNLRSTFGEALTNEFRHTIVHNVMMRLFFATSYYSQFFLQLRQQDESG
jgi:hypothetical protein